MSAIVEAIRVAGSIKNLAHAIGVTSQAVCFWRDGKRTLPADMCMRIEAATGVRCEDLRPDAAWHVLRQPVYHKSPRKTSAANQPQPAAKVA